MGASYRMAIQNMIDETEKVYKKTGRLRDFGTPQEKKIWSDLRTTYRSAISSLQLLDNTISKARAEEELIGDF